MTSPRRTKLKERLDLVAEESAERFIEKNKDALDRLAQE
jgi:hypothetical protein